MLMRSTVMTMLTAAVAAAPMVGCESLPGDEKTQGAVIGGAGGAAAGAAVAKDNRLLGGLIGGALGAAGGYLVGTQMEKNNSDHKDEAIQASEQARQNPADAKDVRDADSADLNDDGFVTLDEIVAMEDAGLSDKEMIARLKKTQQVFRLSDEQETFLRDHDVSNDVIVAMRDINRENDVSGSDVISHG